MPSLNVGFITLNHMVADVFTVLRRSDPISNKGRTSPAMVETFADQRGTVTQQDPADLMRRDDGQMIPRLIFVASPFRFIAEAPGYQPDQIVWNGTTYTVKHLLPYSRFGVGFHEIVAESMNAIDAPQ